MIRPFCPNDTAAVLDVWLAASLAGHGFLPAAYWRARLTDVRDHYLPLSETIVFVDDDSGAVVAFASLIGSFLAGLFVSPAHWGRGIGRRLLELAVRMHPDLDVVIYAQNDRALRFYARNGFVRYSTRLEESTGCTEYCLQYDPAARER